MSSFSFMHSNNPSTHSKCLLKCHSIVNLKKEVRINQAHNNTKANKS